MIPKFRAWHTPFKGKKFGQEMKYGQVGRLITHAEMSPDKYILMQSTGLKDKNGVEIFEGDIVLFSVSDGFNHLDHEKAIVQASECHSGLICKLVDLDLEYRIYYNPVFHTDYEVIGNIYENSELLGTMPKIFAIKADSDDQGWMDSFNGWNDSNYSLNQKIDEKEVEVLESKIDKFNHEVACGPAIRLEEQR